MHVEFASPCLSGMQTDEVAPMDTEAQMRDARAEQNALPESSKGNDAAATDAPLVCNDHRHRFPISGCVAAALRLIACLEAICATTSTKDACVEACGRPTGGAQGQ